MSANNPVSVFSLFNRRGVGRMQQTPDIDFNMFGTNVRHRWYVADFSCGRSGPLVIQNRRNDCSQQNPAVISENSTYNKNKRNNFLINRYCIR